MAKKQVQRPSVNVPAKLTSVSMVGYLAERNVIARRQAKRVLEDFFELIGIGVMRGERVALGKIGKVFIRERPAREPHPGRNPSTGETIMIPAKPATKVPRFTFSKTFKEAALKGQGQ